MFVFKFRMGRYLLYYVSNNVSDFIRRNDKVNSIIKTLLRLNQHCNVTTNVDHHQMEDSGMGKCETLYGIGASMSSEALLIDNAFIICTHFIRLHSPSSARHLACGPIPQTHSSKTNRVQFVRHMVALVSLSFNWWALCKMRNERIPSKRLLAIHYSHYWHIALHHICVANKHNKNQTIATICPNSSIIFRRHNHRTKCTFQFFGCIQW